MTVSDQGIAGQARNDI